MNVKDLKFELELQSNGRIRLTADWSSKTGQIDIYEGVGHKNYLLVIARSGNGSTPRFDQNEECADLKEAYGFIQNYLDSLDPIPVTPKEKPTMLYHPILNSSSGITRAAFDGDSTVYLEFAGKTANNTYAYEREIAESIFASLVNCKPYAASLTDEEKVELQRTLGWTIGSEGSYCLRVLVGPRKEPFANRKLTPEEAEAVWADMPEVESEPV